jgi:hypothetical protein
MITGLTEWLHEFERLHARTFRTVAMVPIGIVTGSPAIGVPRSSPPTSPWHGWRPFPGVGWISSRSFRPTGQLASWEMATWTAPLRAIGITTGLPVIGRALATSRRIRIRDTLWMDYAPGRFDAPVTTEVTMTPEEKQRFMRNLQSLRQGHPDWPVDRLLAEAIEAAGLDHDIGMRIVDTLLKHACSELKREHPDWPHELVKEALRVQWGMERSIKVAPEVE